MMKWGEFRRTLSPVPGHAPGGTGHGTSQMLARVLGVTEDSPGSGRPRDYTAQNARRYRTYRACAEIMGWGVGHRHADWVWPLLDVVQDLDQDCYLILDFGPDPDSLPTLTVSPDGPGIDRLGFGTLVLVHRGT